MRHTLLTLLKEFRKCAKEEAARYTGGNFWWKYSIEDYRGLSLVVTNMYSDADKVQVYDKLSEDNNRALLMFNASDEEAVDLFLA